MPPWVARCATQGGIPVSQCPATCRTLAIQFVLNGIITRPGITEQYYAGKLLYRVLNYLIELLEKGVVIKRIYTVATTEDGDRLARKLHFTPLPGEWQGEFEDFRHPYVLDLETKESQSKLINKYLLNKKNLERRRKRYERQAVK